MKKITESPSLYDDLEHKSFHELLTEINQEDQKVAASVARVIPEVQRMVEIIFEKMKKGGRLFYLGAGTSGRLGILDASECPPTFGVPFDWVVGLIAGGDSAIRRAVEFAEDSATAAWEDLSAHAVNDQDFVVGIAASGTTPYVVRGLELCRENGISTGCITCNHGSPLEKASDYPVVVVVGPEYVTGSSRMKAGTAQKLILNMISTSVMIKLGRVQGNTMVDMQLTNNKLLDRGTKIISKQTGLSYSESMDLLKQKGSVREALFFFFQNNDHG